MRARFLNTKTYFFRLFVVKKMQTAKKCPAEHGGELVRGAVFAPILEAHLLPLYLMANS